jgi:hypothetical protein
MRAATCLLASMLAVSACAVADPDGAYDGTSCEKCDGPGLPALHDRAFYEAIASDAGVALGVGPIVIGLRGVARDGSYHDTHSTASFDDVIAVLPPSGSVIELAAATHPWFTTSEMSPDVDGDGHRDVGMIRPGRYRAESRPPSRDIAGQPTFHIVTVAGSDKLPGWRDTNHDGTFDDTERATSEARGDTLGAVLFHQGGAGAPAAIGCQVFSATSIKSFVTAVGGRSATLDYVLVDAP